MGDSKSDWSQSTLEAALPGPVAVPSPSALALGAAEPTDELFEQISGVAIQVVKIEDQLAALSDGTTTFRQEVLGELSHVRAKLLELNEQVGRIQPSGSGSGSHRSPREGYTQRFQNMEVQNVMLARSQRMILGFAAFQMMLLLLVGLLFLIFNRRSEPTGTAAPSVVQVTSSAPGVTAIANPAAPADGAAAGVQAASDASGQAAAAAPDEPAKADKAKAKKKKRPSKPPKTP